MLFNEQNISCVPPIFHNNRFITDFTEKAELFNSYFANQCSLLRNSSVLPTDSELFTNKSLSNITFADNDIGMIINSLDLNKAHGHDMMSIHMLNICSNSINKPLGLIFRACLEHGGFFLKTGKKPTLFLFTKKRQAIIKEL